MDEKIKSGLLSFSGIIAILAIILIVMGFNKMTAIEDVQKDIDKMNHDKKERVAYNDKIDKKVAKDNEEIGIEQVKNDADKFNDLFFQWDSWKEFSDNRKTLRDDFPKIKDGDVVNISGKDVGNSQSDMNSAYESSQYTSTKQGRMIEMIDQDKTNGGATSESKWYKVSDVKDGQYDVSFLKQYKEVEP